MGVGEVSAGAEQQDASMVTTTPWHGPASVVASALGTLAWFTLLWVWPWDNAPIVLSVVPWVVGLPLLLRRGVVRRIGVGLLASGLLVPVLFALSPANLHRIGVL